MSDYNESDDEVDLDVIELDPDNLDDDAEPDVDEDDVDVVDAEPDVDEELDVDEDVDAEDAEPDVDDEDAEPDVDDEDAEPDVDEEDAEPDVDEDVDAEDAEPHVDDDDDDEYYEAQPDDDDEYYDEEDNLQKMNEDIRRNIIEENHPECLNHNSLEVQAMCNVVRNSEGDIIDKLHKTYPFVTKYEKTRILGLRAKQINTGSKPFIDIPENIIDGYSIANMEYKEKKIPFIIRRPIPNGGSEYWKLKDLEIII